MATITDLARAARVSGHEPRCWQIVEVNDGDFELRYSFVAPEHSGWQPVLLRDKSPKLYKSYKAVFADIRKVSVDQAAIFFVAKKMPR